jgi:hypothetical protein
MALSTSRLSGGGKSLPALYFLCGPCNRGHKNLFCSGAQQHPRALAGCGAGGHHVIHQQNVLSGYLFRPNHGKSSADIRAPLMSREPGLRNGLPLPNQRSGI